MIATADGGCSSCVGGLCQEANKAFPAFHFERREDEDYSLSVEVTEK